MRRVLLLVVLSSVAACSRGDVGMAAGITHTTSPALRATASTAPPVPSSVAAPRGPLRPPVGEPSQVLATIRVGGQPCGVAEAGGWVWVSDAQGGVLSRVDPTTNMVVGTTEVDASPCEMVPGFGALWVATQSGVLDRVEPRTGKVVARIAVGAASYEPLAALGSIWVTNRNSGTVSRVDPRTNKVVATIEVPGIKPGGIVELAGLLWIGNDSAGGRDVVRLDPRSGKQAVFAAGRRPNFVTAAGGSIWTADRDDGTVTRLMPSTGAVQSTSLAGVSPVNLTTLPGPRPEVWVPDDKGNLIIRIDSGTGEVIERLLAGRGPAVATAIAGEIWITNFEDGTVSRIRPGARP